MDRIFHTLIGDPPGAVDAAIKTSTLFLTAAVLFRFTERRTLTEFAPFDWIAAVAAGAIVGRAATASGASWLNAGPGPSYLDSGSGEPENDFTNRNTTFLTYNLLHVAQMLKAAGGIPAYGNQRSKWDAGCRPDFDNPEHR